MDIEKIFREIKNMSEFKVADSLSDSYLKSKKIQALERMLSNIDEDSEDYDVILKEIASLK